MYILKIETFDTEAVKVLKELKLDKEYTEEHENGTNYIFEEHVEEGLNFKIKDMLDKQNYYRNLLEDFEDAEVYFYGDDSDWREAQNLDYFKEYGLKESDFI